MHSFTLFYSVCLLHSVSLSLSLFPLFSSLPLNSPFKFFKAQHCLAMQTLRLQLQANSAFALSLLCFYLSLSALLCHLRHSSTFPCPPPHLAFNYKSSINHNWKIKRIKLAHVFAFRSASIALFLSHSFYVCSPCVCVCVLLRICRRFQSCDDKSTNTHTDIHTCMAGTWTGEGVSEKCCVR